MKEIDEFLQFLLEHESDERISFSKKMKYGYRYYYISFNIDEKPEDDNKKNKSYTNSLKSYMISDSIEIIIDNRNICIELLHDNGIENIIIEDGELVDKWSDILEEYINKNVSTKVKDVIEEALSSCYNKNLYRTYQMKKILPEDESL
jgi:hypothetical protein